MKFIKEITSGIITIMINISVAISTVFSIYLFTFISDVSGWWAVLSFFGCSTYIFVNIAIIWSIGIEQIEYKELSKKRNEEIRQELDNKEKEVEVCITNSTES